MSRDGWQWYPIVSKDDAVQAKRDAAGLFHVLACTSEGFDISCDRMARALAVLAEQWPAWNAKGQPS